VGFGSGSIKAQMHRKPGVSKPTEPTRPIFEKFCLTLTLEYIDLANSLGDLQVPPSNRLHALEGDRAGQYSISINMQWRICFRFVAGDAYDVEITDYH
jgi:plasmid maintenance system killer protein